MSSIVMNKKDEIIMRLVHYFINEQNYTPIIVNGVRDEIWLQNQNGPYKIIRINANYIHNKEQLDFDYVKLHNVMRQVKRKTVSFSMNALNILLDVNDSVSLHNVKHIDSVVVSDILKLPDKPLLETFPDMNKKLLLEENGIDLIVNVTNDINKKTEEENKLYEKTFRTKKIVVTNILIGINLFAFFLVLILSNMELTTGSLIRFGAVYAPLIKAGELWRLLTGTFLHASLLHLLVNMYSLYLIGTQIETYIGKGKYLAIYLISALSGSLLSCIFNGNIVSVGASGAIFGLLGSLLYFGYHYRLYLGSVLRNQIIPIIFVNILLGFMISGIDNAAHIGGLIGGYLATMALGITGRTKEKDRINGTITLVLYVGFLAYALFFL